MRKTISGIELVHTANLTFGYSMIFMFFGLTIANRSLIGALQLPLVIFYQRRLLGSGKEDSIGKVIKTLTRKTYERYI